MQRVVVEKKIWRHLGAETMKNPRYFRSAVCMCVHTRTHKVSNSATRNKSYHWGSSHEGSGRHLRQHGGGRGRRFGKFTANYHRVCSLLRPSFCELIVNVRQVYGKLSPCLFFAAAQLLWIDCQCYGTHWCRIPSCSDSVSRRNSGLKFHVATRVSVMSVFPGTRVSVRPDEGTAVYRWT